jgi:hypothetical protein
MDSSILLIDTMKYEQTLLTGLRYEAIESLSLQRLLTEIIATANFGHENPERLATTTTNPMEMHTRDRTLHRSQHRRWHFSPSKGAAVLECCTTTLAHLADGLQYTSSV